MIAKVFRFENNNGRGIYQSDGCQPLLDLLRESDSFDYPAPDDDKGIERRIHKNEFCGFISLVQAYKWFTKEDICNMVKYGAQLKYIEARVTAIGKHQILLEKL